MMPLSRLRDRLALCAAVAAAAVLGAAPGAHAQFETKWVAAGSLHNWYSAGGSEREEGLGDEQQFGWRWPGIYNLTDMQAAKGLWLGATNVTDEFGTSYPVRVVHIGPRARGVGEMYPTRFELFTRRPLPVVTVDGAQSFASALMEVDGTDDTLVPDVMLVSEFNTLLGVSVERRVMQFSQEYHDNYHVIEYTFTNTGNTDGDPEIENGGRTLTDFYAFLQYRLSVARESRFIIGNATGWGKNAMNDARGDGVMADPPDEQFRAQFTWHGHFPDFQGGYDNLGGPMNFVTSDARLDGVAPGDSLGRLAASAFIGTVTLHADASPTDPTDDPGQPSTTNWIHSDDLYLSDNDPFSVSQMLTEYNVMSQGHESPRHAIAVEPTGLPGFLAPTGDPSLSTPGGYSFGNGYGPYTLAPGESVRIVIAEAAAGLSREANAEIGRQFKASGADSNAPLTYNGQTMTKNEWVFTSRDSLFQTFRRAIGNYASGYDIPRPPDPPGSLTVSSGGDRISLVWDPSPSPVAGYEVYRAPIARDSAYTRIAELGPGETRYDDTTPTRGLDYYYYVLAVGDDRGPGTGDTPGGPLRSSRYYTQTYDPASLKRPQGRTFDDTDELDGIRIVPNPYNISGSNSRTGGGVRFPDRTNKLAFYNIPGFCRIDIYTELGELVDTIEHDDGSGDEFWNHTTSARQIVASGVYIAVITVTRDIEDLDTGEVLFREGERAFRKFVIIR